MTVVRMMTNVNLDRLTTKYMTKLLETVSETDPYRVVDCPISSKELTAYSYAFYTE